MLFKNGENLKSELIHYLTNKENVTIYVPYIKAKTLSMLLRTPNFKCEQIIVRWDRRDIEFGSSDLEVYEICKSNNISLFRNTRIHLKLYTNNFEDAFLGSANISERAISDFGGNYEICSYVKSIDRSDRIYLQKILSESTLITDEIFNSIKDQTLVPPSRLEEKDLLLPNGAENDSNYLITKLPMTDSPQLLWEIYSNEKTPSSQEQENCASHDLALYNIEKNIDCKSNFFKVLGENFLSSPFIVSFLKAVDDAPSTKHGNRYGLQFGLVKIWFRENTTTTPTPRSFELTEYVAILYLWIEHLSNGSYSVSVPGKRSQVIRKTPSL